MKTSLYLFLPTKLAVYNFEQRKAQGVPMLNDAAGESLYANADDAKAFGMYLCDTPEIDSKSVAIVRVEFEQLLRDELEKSGDIKSGGLDGMSHQLTCVSARACARLNAQAEFLMSVHPLPLFVGNHLAPGSTALN